MLQESAADLNKQDALGAHAIALVCGAGRHWRT